MDAFEVLYTTRSMRRVRPDPIPDDVQASILDAAIRAPSGSNRQQWRFIVVDDPGIRKDLAALYREAFDLTIELSYASKIALHEQQQDDPESIQFDKIMRSGRWLAEHFDEVPLLLFPFVWDDPTGKNTYPAIWSAMLAARAHGVGSTITTILTTHRPVETASLLGAPLDSGWHNPCAVTFGYPLGRWGIAARRPVSEVFFRNSWDGPSGVEVDGPLWPVSGEYDPR